MERLGKPLQRNWRQRPRRAPSMNNDATSKPCKLPTRKPQWHGMGRAAKLDLDSRVICPDCHGRQTTASAELDRCDNPGCACHEYCHPCHQNHYPCFVHRCPRCDGSGLVCPACRGDRVVRIAPWDTLRNHGVAELSRCEVCCEGNNVNHTKEMPAIENYLRRQQIRVVQGEIE